MRSQTAPMALAPNVKFIPAKKVNLEHHLLERQLRVAAYCRVSTELEEQQSSYENQINYYTEKINGNKDWRLVKIYADEGLTGTIARKREDFMDMLEDCRKDKIDLILCKSISRFARNTVDTLTIVRELKSLNVGVIFEKEGINTLLLDNEMMLTIWSSFAQAESESISGNIKWSVRKGFAAGKAKYSYRNWFGYQKGADGQPEVIPEHANIVREIFNRYLLGWSTNMISEDLNDRGILRKNGEQWSHSAIQRMLANEKYCGDVLCQKTFVADPISKQTKKNTGELPMYYIFDAHPAIIERAIYNRTQQEIKRRSSKRVAEPDPELGPGGKGKHSGKYALSDLLICGECKTRYKRATWKRGDVIKHVWRCESRLKYGKRYCQHSPTLLEPRLHQAVNKAIMRYASDKESLMQTLMNNLQTVLLADTQADSICELEHRIHELEQTQLELAKTAALAEDAEKFMDSIAEVGAQLQNLRQQHEQLSSEQPQKQGMLKSEMQQLRDTIEKQEFQLDEFDNTLARQLIDGIKVLDESHILVVFRNGEEIRQYIE